MAQLEFFDADKRLEALSAKGDPLEAIETPRSYGIRIIPTMSQRARGVRRYSCYYLTRPSIVERAKLWCMEAKRQIRLICRHCGAQMRLAREMPWLSRGLPAVQLFQCGDCGHVDMVEWPDPENAEA